QRTAEHVIEATILAGALDRDHVGWLLHHADQRGVPPFVLADPATRPLCQVEAELAEPHLLLHLSDRLREAERLRVAGTQDVEGEPLRGPLADAGQAGELRDQSLDRRWVHAA